MLDEARGAFSEPKFKGGRAPICGELRPRTIIPKPRAFFPCAIEQPAATASPGH
jgi:hypothetical protein